MTLLIFLLILSFLVIIHELGHFVTALWMKVKIEEFGLGYPPKAFTLFHWRKIPFTFNWLPFGGFVRMEGEDEGIEDRESRIENQELSKKKLSDKSGVGPFYTKSKKARLFVLLAGVFMNFLFGIFAFTVIYTKMGIPTYSDLAKIGFVADQSPAMEAGIMSGDVVTGVVAENGDTADIKTSQQMVEFVNAHTGEHLVLTIIRGDQEIAIETYARKADEREEQDGAMGVGFDSVEFKFYPWWQMPFRGMAVGIEQSIGLSIMILQAFGDIVVQLFTHAKVPEGVAGPVGIVHQASKSGLFQEGWLTILNFAGMLSINLAILNVLPIPALDGGRVLFVLLETVIGKKRRATIEGRVNQYGFLFLIGLIVLITLKDVWGVIVDWKS